MIRDGSTACDGPDAVIIYLAMSTHSTDHQSRGVFSLKWLYLILLFRFAVHVNRSLDLILILIEPLWKISFSTTIVHSQLD